jgi:Ca2+:H+ antiporter
MILRMLLVFVPIAIGLRFAGVDPLWTFAAAAVAIIPLANLLTESTEKVAAHLGPTVGGLLNASLGNAPEIIIGAFALKNGLPSVVKASITGSILSNLLLAPGLAMLIGGWHREKQKFNAISAGVTAGLMMLAAVGLIIPSLFNLTNDKVEAELSLEIALLLFVLYGLSLLFSLFTHKQWFVAGAVHADDKPLEKSGEAARTGLQKGLAMLVVTAVVLAIVSEILTDALEPATKAMGLSEVFAGVIVVGVLGNVSGIFAAVRFAQNDNVELSLAATLGGAQQVALVVAPVLIFLSYAFGPPMNLLFTPFEVVALALAVVVVGKLTGDGESNWFEGAMLIALFLMFAMGFYFLPISESL